MCPLGDNCCCYRLAISFALDIYVHAFDDLRRWVGEW